MKFEWTISLGNVLQLAGMVGFLIGAWVKLNARLAVIEREQSSASDERRLISLQLRDLTVATARLEGRLAGTGDREKKDFNHG